MIPRQPIPEPLPKDRLCVSIPGNIGEVEGAPSYHLEIVFVQGCEKIVQDLALESCSGSSGILEAWEETANEAGDETAGGAGDGTADSGEGALAVTVVAVIVAAKEAGERVNAVIVVVYARVLPPIALP